MNGKPSTNSYSPRPRTGNGHVFEDIDKLTNAEGLVAFISRRTSTGMYTFAVLKEFQRDGRTEYTQFIPETMIDTYLEMVERAVARVKELRSKDGPLNPLKF